MKSICIADTQAPAIVQGCMRIDAMKPKDLETLIRRDLELGINFFDHADIYGRGVCEELFGKVLKTQPSLRKDMLIQSKCGIHRSETTHYDFSRGCV